MSTHHYDAIVAGAGIWGCTIARRLAESGKRVLMLEKRETIGGNCCCEIDRETGIEIHKYGSHIFHTHIPEVWDFVTRFVKFNGYQHKVLANYQGKTYFLPLGLPLINKYFHVELKPEEVAEFMADKRHSSALFDAFIRGYSAKQWGQSPDQIDPSIIKRIPIRHNYDVNYFNDYCQGIPLDGYNKLFERLLEHPNIEIHCNTAFRIGWTRENKAAFAHCVSPDCPVYYSGPLDALFDYKYGNLHWRTLHFEMETLDIADYQGTSVMNYTEASIPYTRIHEFKHYHPEQTDIMNLSKTIIMREYPASWQVGDEPYYPVDNNVSRELVKKYQSEIAAVPGLIVGGRLGEYKYYDMDKSIASALEVLL